MAKHWRVPANTYKYSEIIEDLPIRSAKIFLAVWFINNNPPKPCMVNLGNCQSSIQP